MARKIGDAFVRVRPDTSRVGSELRRTLAPQVRKEGEQQGRTFGEVFGESSAGPFQAMAKTASDGVRKEFAKLDKSGADAGGKSGGAFSKGFNRELNGLSGLVSAGFSAIPTQAKAGIIAAAVAVGTVFAAAAGAAITAGVLLAVGGGVLAAGIAAAARDPKVAKAWKKVADQGRKSFADFGKHFVGPVQRAAPTFGKVLQKLRPEFDRLGKAFAPVVDKLAPVLAQMAEKILPAIADAAIASLPLFDVLAKHGPKLADAIAKFFDKINAGSPGATKFFDHFLFALEGAIGILGDIILGLTKLYDWISRGTATAIVWLQRLKGWWDTVARAVSIVHGRARDLFGAVNSRGEALIGWFRRLPGRVAAATAGIFAPMLRAFVSVATGIASRLADLVGSIRALPGRIVSALGNTGRLLYSAGRNVIQGLINGIRDKLGELASIASTAAGIIRDHLPFSPAKKGPLSGKGNPFYSGQSIARLVAAGIQSRLPLAAGAARTLAGTLAVGSVGPPIPALATGLAGGRNYHITVNVPPTVHPAEVGRRIVEAIKAYESGSGARWRTA